MGVLMRRVGMIACAAAVLATTSACTRIRTRQGFVLDPVLVAAIQPGLDNRASVERTLGRPTFTGQFGTGDWYYFSRQSRQLAFSEPKPTDQTVLKVTFDQAGNVATVQRSGLEKVVSISPDGDKTQTLGRDRNFFEEIFGNIGQVGAVGQGGGTADNPN